jgi:serine/threonine protein kinase
LSPQDREFLNELEVLLAGRILDGERVDLQAAGGELGRDARRGLERLQQLVRAMAPQPDTGPTEVTPTEPASSRRSDDRFIGDFRLVRMLGEGGMGVVYEAEQQHPRRPVALKVIRGGQHVGPDTLKLFQREAQTMARLRHPGIATLYETGITDDGLHFFAMELVRGPTLSAWIRQRPAGPLVPEEIRLRLSVFKKICDAVAYAHQKGVIHRDLKPGNVLIPKETAGSSFQDAVPDVKVLDFGLARITDSDMQASTYVTEMGKVRGTLPYMSPEQVRGNPDEIDFRTDVYSLGVLLYEMITGRLPYDVSKAQLHDAVRIICEEAPKSITASFSGTKQLHVDVSTIAGKCMEKDPARRYQSVSALSEDVARYLSDQPILARPPSASYQLRKLVARHKGPFAFAATVFLLVAALAVTSTVQAVRVSRERDRANQEAETAKQVSHFLEGLFKVADPSEARGSTITAREILDQGAERIDRELKEQPVVRARLLGVIGAVYGSLGLGEQARPLLQQAADNARAIYGPDSLEYADALGATTFAGNAGMGAVDRPEFVEIRARAHAIRLHHMQPDDPRMAFSYATLGDAQVVAGVPGGEENLQRALELVRHTDPPDDQVHLWILNDLAVYEVGRAEYRKAVDLFREALRIRERIYPEGHGDRNLGLNNLGYTLLLAGERTEARHYIEAAVAANERTYGRDHFQVGLSLHSLGELERQEGHLDRARPLLQRALEIFEHLNSEHPDLPDVLLSLARVDEAEGHLEEAVERLARARQISLHMPGYTAVDPTPDYIRLLRKVGRDEEAARVEAATKNAPR